MKLNQLARKHGAFKKAKRIGRGIGSGLGKTSGKGGKGQTARTGVALNGFEGGQMPLHMRMPKRGFNNIFKKRYQEVNLGAIQAAIDSGKLNAQAKVDAAALMTAGVIRRAKDGVRILGNGELKTKVNIEAAAGSKPAQAAIEKAGGTLVLPPPPKEPARKVGHVWERNAKKAKPAAAAAEGAPAEGKAKKAKPAAARADSGEKKAKAPKAPARGAAPSKS
ncbi:MAG: 50S ribosomal protein L15 [Alphaproteobacteria bacterium]|nr:50S ribosomal protein L15 [Alphaproteobacteria bacterium]